MGAARRGWDPHVHNVTFGSVCVSHVRECIHFSAAPPTRAGSAQHAQTGGSRAETVRSPVKRAELVSRVAGLASPPDFRSQLQRS